MNCKVWILSFQTHSDSSKNTKNSLFYGILKIFCHSWLRPKNGHFGLKPLLLGLKSPEKWFLRCNFKIAVAREFSIFFAHNFKSETSDTMFENFGGTTRTRQGGIPASHTHVQLFFAETCIWYQNVKLRFVSLGCR